MYQNCTPFVGKSLDLSSSGSGSLAVERFENAKTIISTNCTSCHSAGKEAAAFPLTFATENEFVSAGLVVPGDIDGSKLVYRMTRYGGANGRLSNMPPSGSLDQASYDALKTWISMIGVPDQTPSLGGRQFMCNAGTDVPVSNLKRLLRVEIRNTLIDLISPLASADRTAITADLDTSLESFPDDRAEPFTRLANSLSPEMISAQYDVANHFGAQVTLNSVRMTALGGACMAAASPTTTCVNSFIDTFGFKAFRRPLTNDEKASFYSFYQLRGTTGKQDLIALFLLSPEFLYHLENHGSDVGARTDLLRLTGYEVASKLSFQYWQSMPNDELFAAAKNGELATSVGIKAVLDRVIFGTQVARTKVVLGSYFGEWLKLDQLSQLQSTSPSFLAFTAGENLNQPGYNHRADMLAEINDLVDYEVFTHHGSFNDLLTNDISFAKTDALANIYKVPKYTGTGPYVRFPAGERSGLLTRAALLVSGGVESNPIVKGVSMTRNILCN
jgi:hypothetical protein